MTPSVSCHWCRHYGRGAQVACSAPECGVAFCTPCLRNRHGEDAAAEAARGLWLCPPCRDSCGPGCVSCCNCSFCRPAKGLRCTGRVMDQVRAAGFTNVHDWLVHCERERLGMPRMSRGAIAARRWAAAGPGREGTPDLDPYTEAATAAPAPDAAAAHATASGAVVAAADAERLQARKQLPQSGSGGGGGAAGRGIAAYFPVVKRPRVDDGNGAAKAPAQREAQAARSGGGGGGTGGGGAVSGTPAEAHARVAQLETRVAALAAEQARLQATLRATRRDKDAQRDRVAACAAATAACTLCVSACSHARCRHLLLPTSAAESGHRATTQDC